MMAASSMAKAPTPRRCDPPASGGGDDPKPALIGEFGAYRSIAVPLPLRVTQVLDVAAIPLAMPSVSCVIVPVRTVLLVLDTTGLGLCDRLIQEPAQPDAWRLIDRLRVGGTAPPGDLQQTAAMRAPLHAAARAAGS